MEHMEAMLERGDLPVMGIDDALMAETREAVATRDPARRALDLLETREAARALGRWTPAAALGPAGARAFVRSSGAPLTEGIDGLYTRAGYRTVVVPRLPEMAEVAAGEGWVRGPGTRLRARSAPSRRTPWSSTGPSSCRAGARWPPTCACATWPPRATRRTS